MKPIILNGEPIQRDPHQCSGHSFEEGKEGFLSTKTLLLKTFQRGKRGKTEVMFYETVFKQEHLRELHPFLPAYHGLRIIEGRDYIAMENLTSSFSMPNQMDIKMGNQTYDDDASPSFIENRIKKEKGSTTPILGFRLTGIHTYSLSTGNKIKYDRRWGMAIQRDQIVDALSLFFRDGDQKLSFPHLIPMFLERMRNICSWFERQQYYQFYAASLLFIWEADPSKKDAFGQRIDFRFIDFTHAYSIPEELTHRDESTLFGLQTLIKIFEDDLSKYLA